MYSANGAAMVTVPYGCLDVPVATVEAYSFDRVGIVGMDKGAAMVSIFSSIEANPTPAPHPSRLDRRLSFNRLAPPA